MHASFLVQEPRPSVAKKKIRGKPGFESIPPLKNSFLAEDGFSGHLAAALFNMTVV